MPSSISTTRPRRARYTSAIAATLSCGPSKAASAAAWLMLLALDVDWLCNLSMALIKAAGAPAYPMRQPVMA